MTVPAWVLYVLAMTAVWTVAAGSVHPFQLLLGVLGSLLTVPVSYRLLGLKRRFRLRLVAHRIARFARYLLAVFVVDAVRSTWDVALRVVQPVIPMRPGIVAVPVDVPNPVALMLLVDHVILTPGQLVVDIDSERGVLYVHCIDASDPDGVRRQIRALWEEEMREILT